jgi:serine/threonine-protein kinase
VPPISKRLEEATDPRARTVMAARASEAPWAASARPAQGRSLLKTAMIIFALSAAATVLVLRFLTGNEGTASVTAVDASNQPVQAAQVSVDGKVMCTQLPCDLESLSAGKHRITLQATGQSPSEQVVTIRSRKDSKVHFALSRGGNAGLHVRAQATGLRVFVNGEDKGEVPLTLGGLPAGEVTLKIAGNPLYAPFTQTVRLESDSVFTFEPKLVPLRAMITIRPGDNSRGAFVEVIGADRRQALFELPARVEVAPGATYRVRATRTGYHDFESEVAFSAAEAEKEVRVDLDSVSGPRSAPRAAVAPSPGAPPAPAPAPRSAPPSALAAAITPPGATPISPATPPPAAAAGMGTLNINSIPISNALVDGRPVGPTPRQVPVAAGKHSVTFVHPTLGRKTVTVNVVNGKSAVASTKF